MSKKDMVAVLSRFGNEVLREYAIWTELGPDWQPEKRTKGYKLEGKANAILYRNWSLSNDEIDVSGATAIPVKWMEKSGNVSKEIVQQLGVPADTFVYADKQHAVDNYDGLNALLWNFWSLGRASLGSWRVPRNWLSGWGALLGSKLSVYGWSYKDLEKTARAAVPTDG